MANGDLQSFLDLIVGRQLGGGDQFLQAGDNQGFDFSMPLISPEAAAGAQQSPRDVLSAMARNAPAFSDQYFDTLAQFGKFLDAEGNEIHGAPQDIGPPPFIYDKLGKRIGRRRGFEGGDISEDTTSPAVNAADGSGAQAEAAGSGRSSFLRSFFGA